MNSSNSARSRVYWYFMDGNQEMQEITLDLESVNHLVYSETEIKGHKKVI